jgi:hypothetical protein
MIINLRKNDQDDCEPEQQRETAERRREARARDCGRRRAEHQCGIDAKRAGVTGAELRKALVIVRAMAFPPALAARHAPDEGKRGVGCERQEHQRWKPGRPLALRDAGGTERRREEPERDRPDVAEEEPRRGRVDREKRNERGGKCEIRRGGRPAMGKRDGAVGGKAERTHRPGQAVAAVHEVVEIGRPRDDERERYGERDRGGHRSAERRCDRRRRPKRRAPMHDEPRGDPDFADVVAGGDDHERHPGRHPAGNAARERRREQQRDRQEPEPHRVAAGARHRNRVQRPRVGHVRGKRGGAQPQHDDADRGEDERENDGGDRGVRHRLGGSRNGRARLVLGRRVYVKRTAVASAAGGELSQKNGAFARKTPRCRPPGAISPCRSSF